MTPGGAAGNFDSWNFVLGANLGISSITFDYEDPQGEFNQFPNQGSFGITAPGNVLLVFDMIDGDYSYSDTFGPLTDTGNYLVELTGNFVFPSATWTTVFNVVSTGDEPPVGAPIPGTLVLLGVGLAGLGLMRRRQFTD